MVQQFVNIFTELLQDNPKLKKRIAEYQALDLWNRVVSTSAAKHSAPDKITKGILFVNTSSGSWAQQLTLLKPKIIKNINEKLSAPLIKDIRFKPSGLARDREAELEAEDTAQRIKIKCDICGVEWMGRGAACPQCLRAAKREREINIMRIIERSPWVKFGQVKEEILDLEIGEFEQKKRYLKNRIYDTIKNICKQSESGDKTHKAKLRSTVCDFVFLQTEIVPKDLDETIIKNVIGGEIYSLIRSEKVRGRKKRDGEKQSKRSL